MRILIHSVAPWIGSGYGVQTSLLAPRLRDLGHEVAISALTGLQGAALQWQGISVYPSGQKPFSYDVLLEHLAAFRADVLITIMDFRMLQPIADDLRRVRTLAWMPVDCTPLSKLDEQIISASGALPVAMSRFGETQLRDAGLSPRYAPHMVDRSVFRAQSPERRRELREEAGLGQDEFIIGINAANHDGMRKAFPEQFEGFRRVREKVRTARLLVHSVMNSTHGIHLGQLADDLEIAEHVTFSDTYAQVAGFMDSATMADWYACCDVLSLCSYGEGFGVPLIEAQACGVPVIATAASATEELSTFGWRVKGEASWNPVHRAWWTRPSISQISGAYREAHRVMNTSLGPRRRHDAELFADQYDADRVVDLYWRPILESLEAS